MMNSFHLRFLAADHPIYDGECESLEFPAFDGQYGIQANHKSCVSAVVPGILKMRAPGKETESFSVSEGLIKVEKNETLVLVDTAERPEEIDENKAKLEEAAAREAVLQKKSLLEYHTAQAKIARELSRLNAKRH